MILLAAGIAMLAVIALRFDRLFAAAHESRATKMVRTLLWGASALIAVEALLGAARLLTARNTFLGLATLALAIVALVRRPPPAPAAREPFSILDAGLAAALVAAFAFRLWDGLHRTTSLYDTLSYHLHVPATWMHDERLSIVPAVFGDPSPAYAPSNLELCFLFLMAPLRSDYLAGAGQLPFAVLAVTGIVATVRETGARRGFALGAGLAFLLVPEVWTQAPTAMTDLGLAAFLLSSLPFAAVLSRTTSPRRADLLVFATAVGLAIGTKYAGAALALPFFALGAIAIARARPADARGIALAVAALLATGGFWYVRNAIVTANPLYPVATPGVPLPALYGGREMRAWDYHIPVSDLGALGSMLIAAGVAFASASAIAIARLWRSVLGALPVALVVVFWFGVPYQESRFLLPALGGAAVALGIAAERKPARTMGVVGLAAAVLGAVLEFPTRQRLLLLPIGALGAALFAGGRRIGLRPSATRARAGAAVAVVACFGALAAGFARYQARPPRYSVGDPDLAAAWAWLDTNVRDAQVAYTGNNLAFPLTGERLANRVRYVNVAGAPGDLLHDFGPPGDGTAEPAPYRRAASPAVWMTNLRAARTRVLFVATLYPGVQRTIAVDRDEFPVERAWADARPDTFRLRYANASVRIYDVELR